MRGTIGIVLPNLPALVARLWMIKDALAGTQFSFSETATGEADMNGWVAVEVTCPWGNRFVVHGLRQPAAEAAVSPPSADASKMELLHHPVQASFGIRGQPGIKYVEVLMNGGCSKRAAKWR